MQVDTRRLAELEAQITRCEQTLQSCQLQSGSKGPCTRRLEEELQALDEFRAEKALQDSVQSSRRKLHIALLQLYLSQDATEHAQSWFRAHFSVRPPTDTELFGLGPRVNAFVGTQISELAKAGEQKVIFEVRAPCMVFVNHSEVDREIQLPPGQYIAYTVNPDLTKASVPKTIEIRNSPGALRVPLRCAEAKQEPTPVKDDESKTNNAKPTKSKAAQADRSPPADKVKRKLTKVPPSTQDLAKVPATRVSKTPERLLPLSYEVAGLGAGLLAVAGGAIALPMHGKCKNWVEAPEGVSCRDRAAWHTRPQSWVAIGLGSALAVTSTVFLLIDHRRVKRARTATAWKLQFGQLRF